MTTHATTNCQRCGRICRRGGPGNPEARMLRRAREGVCVECGVVEFLQRLDNMHGGHMLPADPREALRMPHVQEQFAAVMRAGLADAAPDEIDWERVIEVWDVAPRQPGTLF